MRRGTSLIGVALAAAAALVVTYLALGGADYAPSAVADPCDRREWRDPDDVEEGAEQFALSALDGAACELRITRETLAVALATPQSRQRFAAAHGIEAAELEAAVRAGLVRAIDDAEAADALPGIVADPARELAKRMPVDEAIALIEDARELFRGGLDLLPY